MRALRDTWLHYLADNLPGIVVHPLRRTKENPSLVDFAVNAVNVQFVGDIFGVSVAHTTVAIDVINDNENDCLDMVQAVWHLLATQGSTPKYDYSAVTTVGMGTTPFGLSGYGSPAEIPTGTSISWNPEKVQFRYVYSDFACRYSCLLILTHHPLL